jgi:hypothetical protein
MDKPTPRDVELAERAIRFALLSQPAERIANVAILFSLARYEGRDEAFGEMQEKVKAIAVNAIEAPLSRVR